MASKKTPRPTRILAIDGRQYEMTGNYLVMRYANGGMIVDSKELQTNILFDILWLQHKALANKHRRVRK